MEIKAVNYAASCANSDLQYCFFYEFTQCFDEKFTGSSYF